MIVDCKEQSSINVNKKRLEQKNKHFFSNHAHAIDINTGMK